MHVIWSADSDESEVEVSGSESRDEQILNLILMGIVDEKCSPIDINVIIANKNITDSITIEALRTVAIMRNKEMQLKEQYEDNAQSASNFTTEIILNFNDEIGNKSEDDITSNFDDTSIFLEWKNLIIDNESRLKTHMNKLNNVLFKKESIFEDLKSKILEIESNIKKLSLN
jgi:hypothetical protein